MKLMTRLAVRACCGFGAYLLLHSLTWAQPLCAKPWIVGVTDRLPLQGYSQNNQPTGLEVALLRMAAAQLHCEIDFQNIPWKRQFLYAEQGQVSIVMGAGKRKERETYLYYFKPYLHEPTVLVFNQDVALKPPIAKLLDVLKLPPSFTIGVQIGSSYSQEFDDLMRNEVFAKHLMSSSSNEGVMKMLLAHRVQAALFGDPFEPYSLLKKLDTSAQISMLSLDLTGTDFAYFTYSKKVFDETSAKKIDETIIGIVNSPVFDTLLIQYFQKDEIKILTNRLGFKSKSQ